MKIIHVITDLNTGGAEIILHRLLDHIDRGRFAPVVISLTEQGPIGRRIESLGIPVESLGMRRGVPDPTAVIRLAHRLRHHQPSVVQTWMYHADLLGGLAARLGCAAPVAWGVHTSHLDPKTTRTSTQLTVKACARLSRHIPDRIVCCAESSRILHERLGYPPDRMISIPNGTDLELFRPDPAARRSVRQELGLSDDTLLVGMLARFDPQKDHRGLIKAAAILKAPAHVHFLLCGSGLNWDNVELAGWISDAGLCDRVHLLGVRQDPPRIQASLDIAVLSSAYGEAFSLAVGEAMACGVPCIVTDVGDSARIVGDTGMVVPPGGPQALACALSRMIGMDHHERSALGTLARERIGQHFSLSRMVEGYSALYDEMRDRSDRRARRQKVADQMPQDGSPWKLNDVERKG